MARRRWRGIKQTNVETQLEISFEWNRENNNKLVIYTNYQRKGFFFSSPSFPAAPIIADELLTKMEKKKRIEVGQRSYGPSTLQYGSFKMRLCSAIREKKFSNRGTILFNEELLKFRQLEKSDIGSSHRASIYSEVPQVTIMLNAENMLFIRWLPCNSPNSLIVSPTVHLADTTNPDNFQQVVFFQSYRNCKKSATYPLCSTL